MSTTVATSTMLEAALKAAELGGPVFPLQPNGKTPLGSLAPHSFKDATTDLEQIKAWWSQEPTANIGLRTGQASGLLRAPANS